MTDNENDVTYEHIRQSNLIEGVIDPKEIDQSMMAWRYIRDFQGPLTFEEVLTIHNMVMINLLPQERGGAGSLRMCNVTVGGRMCPHYREVKEQLAHWLDEMQLYMHRSKPKDMHIKFEYIHPFVDGNGRTGRMLMWWHERKLGLKPTLLTFEDRYKYYAWF